MTLLIKNFCCRSWSKSYFWKQNEEDTHKRLVDFFSIFCSEQFESLDLWIHSHRPPLPLITRDLFPQLTSLSSWKERAQFHWEFWTVFVQFRLCSTIYMNSFIWYTHKNTFFCRCLLINYSCSQLRFFSSQDVIIKFKLSFYIFAWSNKIV